MPSIRPAARPLAAAAAAAALLIPAASAQAGQGLFITVVNDLAPAAEPGYPRVTVHARGQQVCWYTNDLANWDRDDAGRPMNAGPGESARLYTEVQNSGICNTVVGLREIVRYRQYGYYVRESAASGWEPLTSPDMSGGTAMVVYQKLGPFDMTGWNFWFSGPLGRETMTTPSGRTLCIDADPGMMHVPPDRITFRFTATGCRRPGAPATASAAGAPRVRVPAGRTTGLTVGSWPVPGARWVVRGCDGPAARLTGVVRGGPLALVEVAGVRPGRATCAVERIRDGRVLSRREFGVTVS